MNDEDRIAAVEKTLGYHFKKPALLLRALTHSSFANEAPQAADNERLEFLGDAVLSMAVSARLMAQFPDADEGELTQRRAAFVSEGPLAAGARACGLGAFLRLGRGQKSAGGQTHAAILSDAVEAVFAAVFLDGGFAAAERAVFAVLGELPSGAPRAEVDAKTELQELVQALVHLRPSYETERTTGPDHAPNFIAHAVVGRRRLAKGEGRSKKLAQRAAAQGALASLTACRDDDERRSLLQ